jgi:tetratricopeptide (TPR) repeat protein
MGRLSDRDIDKLITKARQSRDVARALDQLQAACEMLAGERGDGDEAVGRLWTAMAELVCEQDVPALRMTVLERAALWFETHLGLKHPRTLRALADMGEAADEDMAWPTAIRAWEKIVDAELADPARPELMIVSRALRGLGARRMAAQRNDEAVTLFERDLALCERIYGADPDPTKLKLRLDNLASALERQGDTARAAALRARATRSS